MSLIKAQVATKNRIRIGNKYRQFDDKSIYQLVASAVGKPITIQFGPTKVGYVVRSWQNLNDGSAWVEFESDIDKDLFTHLVPGFKIASSKGEIFNTVRCVDFALTNKPVDPNLMSIYDANKYDDGINWSEIEEFLDDNGMCISL